MTSLIRATAYRIPLRRLVGLLAAVGLLLAVQSPASAQSVTDIVDEIERNGFYVDSSVDADLAEAIDRANSAGAAFVWLDQEGAEAEAAELAGAVWDELDGRGSQYGIVVVLLRNGYNVQAPLGFDQATLEAADLAALNGFSSRDEARGLSDFTDAITAGSAAGSAGSEGSATTPTTQAPSGGSGGGIGLGSIVLPLILVGGGFLLFRNWRSRRNTKKVTAAELEADRLEIKEQLRDNADRVIELGDRAVASENNELIHAYEQASRTYQDVSHEIDSATTVEEVDALDDRIDHAEWQFEMIEATLDGRPVPPSPAEVEAEELRRAEAEAARKGAENDKPALGRNESVLAPGSARHRPNYAPTSYPGGYGRRRGGMGGGLGGLIGSIILGQMGGNQSRRSQRRSGSLGGGSRGGSLGGGVLRPGGSSGRPRRRSSGRSFGGSGRRRGSGRSF